MDEYVEDHVAANAMIPAPAVVIPPTYALVEIFGHRQHCGEIREVEAFGTKLLEIADVDSGKLHRYGGASIFSLTMLSQEEFEAHVAAVKRRKERDARWEAEAAARRASRAAADADPDDDCPI